MVVTRSALRNLLLAGAVQASACFASAVPPADQVLQHGVLFTADKHVPVAEAIAIRGGTIAFVGSSAAAAAYIGPLTRVTDLHSRFVMPGIIDGHMHPFMAGAALRKCDLNYQAQTIPEFQAAIQACLDKTSEREPDSWLEVVNWNRESMLPIGTTVTGKALDALKTRRPIIAISSQRHAGITNQRGLDLAKITKSTPNPVGGHIDRDASGAATGLLEEPAAYGLITAILPSPTAQDNVDSAEAAERALNQQGVTTFLDAWASEESMFSFQALSKKGQLSVRAHFAPAITPDEAPRIGSAIDRIVGFRERYDQGPERPEPGIVVRNAKLFLDGVIYAPAFTGSMVKPYRQNNGTADEANWGRGTNYGPPVYFPPRVLNQALLALARAGIDPHMHADGDGAVRAALDAVEVLRRTYPRLDIRPAIAHDEIVHPADYPRFKSLNVTAALGFQWGQRADYTLGLSDYLGAARMRILEPSGLLANAGARLSLGSDWPVDALDEWFAIKVAVTRAGRPDAALPYRGRLGSDPGLTVDAALRAATINGAYQLHDDDKVGSLTIGKFADLIILDLLSAHRWGHFRQFSTSR